MAITATTGTIMTDAGDDPHRALYRLLTWLSPSYPVGAFSYSQGLETAIAEGLVHDPASLTDWLTGSLANGTLSSDAVFFARAHDAVLASDWDAVLAIAAYAEAFQPAAELRLETLGQGAAFLAVTGHAWTCPVLDAVIARSAGTKIPYPVAVAAVAGAHGIDRSLALHAFLHGTLANLVSAAIRLVPLGQSDGQRVVAAMEPFIEAAGKRADTTALQAVATFSLMAEICSMRHETQETRLFRS